MDSLTWRTQRHIDLIHQALLCGMTVCIKGHADDNYYAICDLMSKRFPTHAFMRCAESPKAIIIRSPITYALKPHIVFELRSGVLEESDGILHTICRGVSHDLLVSANYLLGSPDSDDSDYSPASQAFFMDNLLGDYRTFLTKVITAVFPPDMHEDTLRIKEGIKSLPPQARPAQLDAYAQRVLPHICLAEPSGASMTAFEMLWQDITRMLEVIPPEIVQQLFPYEPPIQDSAARTEYFTGE